MTNLHNLISCGCYLLTYTVFPPSCHLVPAVRKKTYCNLSLHLFNWPELNKLRCSIARHSIESPFVWSHLSPSCHSNLTFSWWGCPELCNTPADYTTSDRKLLYNDKTNDKIPPLAHRHPGPRSASTSLLSVPASDEPISHLKFLLLVSTRKTLHDFAPSTIKCYFISITPINKVI